MGVRTVVNDAWISFLRRAKEELLIAQGVPRLDRATPEPPPGTSRRPDGICAVGGDLGTDRLLAAYGNGAYPWFRPDEPLLWRAPDPRYVIDLARLRFPREVDRAMRRSRFETTLDRSFDEVITASSARPDAQRVNAFLRLHRTGHAHSVECWMDGQLVAGAYGLALGAVFFGEGAFSRMKEAGIVAFASLHARLRDWGFSFVDCQIHSKSLERLGQEPWSRAHFLERLKAAVTQPARIGSWSLEGPSPLVGKVPWSGEVAQ